MRRLDRGGAAVRGADGADDRGGRRTDLLRQKATIVDTKKADRLVGTDRRDVIVGLGGDDRIQGGRGDDLICAAAGADVLFGGPGDDQINGGAGRLYVSREGTLIANDRIVPGAGNDLIVPVYDDRAFSYTRDLIDYSDSPRAVKVDVPGKVVTGHGRDRLTTTAVEFYGSDYDDVMTGGSGRDGFHGNDGGDLLRGEDGDDLLYDGSAWADQEKPDRDHLIGGGGNDQLDGRAGRDFLEGGAGNDDVVDYGRSSDRIDGGPGNDGLMDTLVLKADTVIDGGSGRDEISVYNEFRRDGKKVYPRVVVDLRSGITTVKAPAPVTAKVTGIEFLNQWDVPLTFYGADASETIWSGLVEARMVAHGYGGNDEFWGTGRDDLLDGGDGNDKAVPGDGTDRCVSMERQQGRCEVNE